MSAPSASVPASGDGLRVVFFGPPGSGKTALLAVLGAAQEQQLQGRLDDPSQGLTALRKAVGQPSPDGNSSAIPVTFQPLPGPSGATPASASAVLIDCPGKAAAELLAKPWGPKDHAADEGLAGEVLRADTLVLPLDAGATPEQLDTYFESFGIFLRSLEVQRGRRLEVAGLPVFLVLTKCDRLAKPTDAPIDWIERIEDRKREVDARFHTYLSREGEQGTPAFGAVDVHCWATAAQRPALVGSPKSRESYGVAELFRQCLQEATAYRQRQRRSESRLTWTVWTAVILVVLMAAVTLGQILSSGRVKSDLELRVQNLRDWYAERQEAPERFNTPTVELNRRAERLQKLRDDPGFEALPSDDQQFVQERLTELRAYLALLTSVPPPRVLMELKSLKELSKLREELNRESPPKEWAATDAVRRLKERLADFDALEDAVLTVQARFRTDTDKAGMLLDFKDDLPGPAWLDDARKLLTPDPKSSFTPADRIPGSSSLTYGTALAFEDVRSDRLAWEQRRNNLASVRDLIAALGLAGAGVEPPPVLAFPKTFSLDDAAERATLLKKHYPRAATDLSLAALPVSVKQQVMREARRSYENLLRPVRELVAQEAGAAEDWDKVRRLVRSPRELENWRTLARALTPLLDGPSRDPVEELDAFVRERSYRLNPLRFVLEVPANSAARARPPATAVLTIEYVKGDEKSVLSFPLDNTKTEEDPVNRVTRYVFSRPPGRDLQYEPGGELTASVVAVDGRRLTWKNRQASNVYQIERLMLPPVLHRENQPVTEGTVETGVHLLCTDPPDGLPRWPDLLQKPAR